MDGLDVAGGGVFLRHRRDAGCDDGVGAEVADGAAQGLPANPDPDAPDERTALPLAIEDWLTVIVMALLALIMRKG